LHIPTFGMEIKCKCTKNPRSYIFSENVRHTKFD
jgi:hypothetical protein